MIDCDQTYPNTSIRNTLLLASGKRSSKFKSILQNKHHRCLIQPSLHIAFLLLAQEHLEQQYLVSVLLK